MEMKLVKRIFGSLAVLSFVAFAAAFGRVLLIKDHCPNCGNHTHVIHNCK